MTPHEAKCTPNNQCKCIVSNEKQGMLLREMQNFSSNDKCNRSYMKSWLILQSKSSASTMQNAKMQCIMMQIRKYFWIFWNKNEILKKKNDSTTPRLGKHDQTILTQTTKVKEI